MSGDYCPIPCILCGAKLRNCFEEPNQPARATAFYSGGHYGSTVFDPMDNTYLEINFCDPCLSERGRRNQVLHHRAVEPRKLKTPRRWKPPAQGMAAATAGETRSGSTEGNSPVGSADALKNSSPPQALTE